MEKITNSYLCSCSIFVTWKRSTVHFCIDAVPLKSRQSWMLWKNVHPSIQPASFCTRCLRQLLLILEYSFPYIMLSRDNFLLAASFTFSDLLYTYTYSCAAQHACIFPTVISSCKFSLSPSLSFVCTHSAPSGFFKPLLRRAKNMQR